MFPRIYMPEIRLFTNFLYSSEKLQENILDLFNGGTSDFLFGTTSICHIEINQQIKTKNQPKPNPTICTKSISEEKLARGAELSVLSSVI